MPIRGLTDSVQPAFPRIGRLRKGGPATRNEAGQVVKMGPDLDHFRFDSDRPEVVAAFQEVYGDKPALVRAYLPYADVESNFACWKENWTQGGLVHRCDGETMMLWLDKDGKYRHDPKPCDGGCDEVGRLSLIIPELVKAGFVGYVVCQTHGINDLISIQGSLLAAAEARVGNPLGLRGIQWILTRRKEKISTPSQNGKRARRDKWLVKLEPAADWVALQLQAAHNATMMLPAPKAETVDRVTGEIVDSTASAIGDDDLPIDDDEGFDSPAHSTGDLRPGDLTASPIPEEHDEQGAIEDARAKVAKLMAEKGTKEQQVDGWCQKHLGCSYAGATLDGLNALIEALAAIKAKAGAGE